MKRTNNPFNVAIAPREPAPRYPNWLRQLSYPPWRVHLDEDAWPLIEHIRLKGQIGSGAIYHQGRDPFDPPWENEGSPPLDKNAPERQAALRDLAQRQAAQEELKRFLQSPEQVRKRRLARAKYERDRIQLAEQRRKLEREHQRIRAERAAEQQRRDVEWDRGQPDQPAETIRSKS